MLFELANAGSPGERRYNWDKKVMIGLQANELSTILAEPDANHDFYHDTCEPAAAALGLEALVVGPNISL